ncbi:MAG: hypothetical protein IPJ33_05405 [Gammaproteobacteria bacterium]|jgi:hypothetical protein|nr:hypothetical protein [Gammaproteobacteria bacterium]MBP6050860.1 hypothetical protein [Pseudomonadales bacterium]MBK6584353.1 hypothetical protein [Gammaproteobacteria bacterium]MBK7168406.1 hypothetical protein [Gammaproteobacteria bacterium]MBK7520813.1 hypothetical protein [Gammaproteobacteria bacterium]
MSLIARIVALPCLLWALCAGSPAALAGAGPILFVTQVPWVGFTTIAEAFGTQRAEMQSVPRGGDLWIRYPDGTLRNLTQEAGFGSTGSQDVTGIAVRQPVVHWSGERALFSMVVGAPGKRYEVADYRWQLYEVSGLAQGQSAKISKVRCQPGAYNNIAPAYGSDDSIIFVSDRPRSGLARLYPQRDEYESTPIDTGLWKIDPLACRFKLIEHAPSGVTYPTVDSYGRILFTKWDHLQRDQQADADVFDAGSYGSFNYASESSTVVPAVPTRTEYFPELRRAAYSLLPAQGYDGKRIAANYPLNGHTFNHFFPWTLNQDGSEEETLNHIGRHELGGSYSEANFRNDPALSYFQPGKFNAAPIFLSGSGGTFHLREDPLVRGRIWSVRAPEFSTATAGDLIRLQGAPDASPEKSRVVLVASKSTFGRFRNPLPLSDGRLLVVHTPHKGDEENSGSTSTPEINYDFRIREFHLAPKALGELLTAGIQQCVSWWDPDQRVNWCGTMWELDPVEVVARVVPRKRVAPPLPARERQVLAAAGVGEALLRNWLHARDLALIVSRNVTARDRADEQQPFNLAVAGGGAETIGLGGAKIYPVSHMQLFQADQIRGYFRYQSSVPKPGRRVLAVPMHHPAALAAMGDYPSGPQGAVPLASDGSMAAFVPARRALAWQLIDAGKSGWEQAVVRERNWISFKPGERRVCTACHGINKLDQSGNLPPANPPQALARLLGEWKDVVRNHCPPDGGTGSWSYSGVEWSACDENSRYRIQACAGGNGCCNGMPKTQTLECP